MAKISIYVLPNYYNDHLCIPNIPNYNGHPNYNNDHLCTPTYYMYNDH